VLPGPHKVDVLTFRGGTLRQGSIWGNFDDRSNGILLTATRGNKRPFAARVLIVKQGSSHLYDLAMPPNDKGDGFDEDSKNYKIALAEFKKIAKDTTFPENGFMWGTRPPDN